MSHTLHLLKLLITHAKQSLLLLMISFVTWKIPWCICDIPSASTLTIDGCGGVNQGVVETGMKQHNRKPEQYYKFMAYAMKAMVVCNNYYFKFSQSYEHVL